MSRQTALEELGAAIKALTEEWDREAYADCGPIEPGYVHDAQWPSACDFIERVFALRIEICGQTDAHKAAYAEGSKV